MYNNMRKVFMSIVWFVWAMRSWMTWAEDKLLIVITWTAEEGQFIKVRPRRLQNKISRVTCKL